MPPPPLHLMFLIPELVFTLFAVIFCSLIFFRTKEIDALAKHRGIHYFRLAFLFFGLSYAVRLFFGPGFFSRLAFHIPLSRLAFMMFFILLLGYLSTMGILYLLFSSLWKKAHGPALVWIGHGLAAALSVVSFLFRSHLILLFLQTVLLMVAVLLRFLPRKQEKHLSSAKVLYLLVFVLWLINLWVIGRPRPLPLDVDLLFEGVSIVVFIIIYRKILKWVR
ncbi:MAG: hypothetical protein V1735_07130 [Nanoarchaeota archaeon]|jgi:hypothetical protein